MASEDTSDSDVVVLDALHVATERLQRVAPQRLADNPSLRAAIEELRDICDALWWALDDESDRGRFRAGVVVRCRPGT